MPTQVQIRGAAQAMQEARTLVSRELDVNTTDGRISIHDGSTAGGIPHANFRDIQNQEYTYAAASGTNAITVTLAKAPAAYAAGQKFAFKAANNNTGSATYNVNGLGAVTIKKATILGLVTLDPDDIVKDGIYEVTYSTTGPEFILTGSASPSSCQLIDDVDLSGINLTVIPLDGQAYKSVRIEFINADCGGNFFTRLYLGGSEYTLNNYNNYLYTVSGVSSANLQGNYNSYVSQGEWLFNGISGEYVDGVFWLHNLTGSTPFFHGTFLDSSRVTWNFTGNINTTSAGAVTDFQVGRSGSSNFASGSRVRVWGYL